VTKNAYPTNADYNLAIKYSSRFVLDPILRRGTPRSKSGTPVAQGGQPLFFLGGFAKVYIVESGGKTYALRVWLVEIPEAAERYQITSDFLRKQRIPAFVDFEFISNGIVFNGRKYPILRMEWINGDSLRTFIEENLSRPDLIKAAAYEFREVIKELHKARVVHGDLQSDNMILRVNNGAVSYDLIDYDTLIVPGLVGRPIVSTGLPSYQHPNRSASPRATEKDDFFSELVIYLCLLSVAENPKLWTKFPAKGRDKELLFEGADYRSKVPTALFRALYDMGGVIQNLTVILWNFSRCNSIADLIPLERALELAVDVAATQSAPSTTKGARSAFDKYLESKRSRGRAPSGAPASWLDDAGFRSITNQPSSQPVTLTRSTRANRSASKPSFAEVLAGTKLASQHSPPTPPTPDVIKTRLIVCAIVVVAVILLIIVSNISWRSQDSPTLVTPRGASPYKISSPAEYDPPQMTPAGVRGGTNRDVPSSWDTPSASANSSPVGDTNRPYSAASNVAIDSTPAVITYRVVNVKADDRLMLRDGPGINYAILANISPAARGIELKEHRISNGDTIWQEILIEGYRGYVNEIYLEPEP
jgi:serine/threonine protein kinase